MKTNHYLTLILISVFTLLNTQSTAQAPEWLWANAIGGPNGNDISTSIAVDRNSNVYTVGHFHWTVDFDPGPGVFNLNGTGSNDVFISKLDAAGNFIWAKEVLGSGLINATTVLTDTLDNVYVSGYFTGTADFDPGQDSFYINTNSSYSTFIMKLNSAGDMLWTKKIGGASGANEVGRDALSMAFDNQWNIYLTGNFAGTIDFDPDSINTFNLMSYTNEDLFFSKYDNNGNLIWAKTTGGTGSATGMSMTLDKYSNVYITGYFISSLDFDPNIAGSAYLTSSGMKDIFILKLDSAGQFIWVKRIGDLNEDKGNSIVLDASSNIYVTGSFTDTVDFDPNSTGVFKLPVYNSNAENFITKLDSSGNLIWAKEMGTFSSNKRSYISIDIHSYLYIAAAFDANSDLDPGPATTNLISNGQGDVCVAKLDGAGNLIWTKQIGGGVMDEIECPVVTDNTLSIFITGRFSSSSISSDSILLINSDNSGYSDIFIARLDSQKVPLNINPLNLISGATIYPNPVYQNFTIDLYRNYDDVEITISDITGKLFYKSSKKGVQKTEISTDYFSNGIYLVRIKSDDFVETKKIIVSK